MVSITLYIFGGIAQLGGKPKTPGAEFRIAAVGPVSSLVLAAIFYGLNQAFGDRGYFGASSEWLAYINLILALFNLLPGYPLDGGRILESIVWGLTGKAGNGRQGRRHGRPDHRLRTDRARRISRVPG